MNEHTASAVVQWIVGRLRENKETSSIIRFHGGEPLLNITIIRFLISGFEQYREEFDFLYEMTTNGYVLFERDVDFLVNNIHNLSISLDGVKEINDKYRVLEDGSGTFDKVYNNILVLKKKKRDLIIRMTVTSKMAEYLCENVLYFLKSGIRNIMIALDIWDEEWTSNDLDAVEEQCNLIQKYLKEKDINDVKIDYPLKSEIKRRKCEGAISGFQIDTCGCLFPCSYTVGDSEYCCGSVFVGVDQNKVRCFEKINLMQVEGCIGCTNYDNCMTIRCKFINKKRMGDYYIPIPLICEIENKKILASLEE